MSLPTTIETRLVTSDSEEIRAILQTKAQEYADKNLPIEECVSDYIGRSIEEMDNKVTQLKKYKADITDAINAITEHKKEAMKECYLSLKEDFGVDKLKGVSVSSVTLKDESVSITKRFVLDEDKERLVELGYAHYEEVFKEIPATIKINKKRVKNEDK